MITNNNPTLTGAEILWATLVGEGVTTIFGYRQRHPNALPTRSAAQP